MNPPLTHLQQARRMMDNVNPTLLPDTQSAAAAVASTHALIDIAETLRSIHRVLDKGL